MKPCKRIKPEYHYIVITKEHMDQVIRGGSDEMIIEDDNEVCTSVDVYAKVVDGKLIYDGKIKTSSDPVEICCGDVLLMTSPYVDLSDYRDTGIKFKEYIHYQYSSEQPVWLLSAKQFAKHFTVTEKE